MKIFFLDQSGKPGGAELCLLDLVKAMPGQCMVGLLEDGPFRKLLEEAKIAVRVFDDQSLQVRKGSGLRQGISSLGKLIPLANRIAVEARNYDAIYANTPKALVVGALACSLSRRPLIYHLHDIISADHFSYINRRLLILLANQFTCLVIANSQASLAALKEEGGRANLARVVYNGFDPSVYQIDSTVSGALRTELGINNQFVVGHFSRLSPWKGQHVLLKALAKCPEQVGALFVGDDLFGEADYVSHLHFLVKELDLAHRVKFLGFRSDIPHLMSACDLVVHSSTAPEPFGRVIVEAMLSGTPIIAAAAGGAMELVEHGKTGWLCPPEDDDKLAELICQSWKQNELTRAVSKQAQLVAQRRFCINTVNQKIINLLVNCIGK